VLLCLELTSLHIQPASDEIDQVVAHALFADGASAVVVQPGGSGAAGFDVVDVVAQTDVSTAEHMTWDVTDQGFRMGLSPRVPAVLARHVTGVVDGLLAAHGLHRSDVDGWAVHPGGRRILEVVERRLGLPSDALDASYAVLAEHGNCSSPTVLMVLDRIRSAGRVPPGRHAIAMAFGPGLTLYAALLRAT
jgi:predicted naringenin-chalcone synthase